MNRLPLAALPLLLTAAAGAVADIVVEERSLTGASSPRLAAAGTTAAPSVAAASADAGSGSPQWDQYNQVQQLQQQVQQLQGTVEQQGFLIEKLQNDLRVRYKDLDQRLTAQQEQLQQAASAAAASAPATPAGDPPAAPPSASIEEEKRAYLAAYDTFRAGGPDKAIAPMLAFVKRYPNSTFVPSAYYWLGEFYLSAGTPDPVAAQKQFDVVLQNYPDSPKAPAALYKTAAILDGRGKPQEAKKRMQELLDKYPTSPEATLAKNYLKELEAPAPAEKPAKPVKAAKASKPGTKSSSKISRKN